MTSETVRKCIFPGKSGERMIKEQDPLTQGHNGILRDEYDKKGF